MTPARWLIALSVVLTGVTGALTVSLWRAGNTLRDLEQAHASARIERDELQLRLAREQATREALALEVGRRRSSEAPAGHSIPTLTLTPNGARTGEPPEPTLSAPAQAQPIELRLILPADASRPTPKPPYQVTVRTWSTGQMIWSRGDLQTTTIDTRPAVTALVTGDVFATGAYEVLLNSAAGEVAAYEVGVR